MVARNSGDHAARLFHTQQRARILMLMMLYCHKAGSIQHGDGNYRIYRYTMTSLSPRI